MKFLKDIVGKGGKVAYRSISSPSNIVFNDAEGKFHNFI